MSIVDDLMNNLGREIGKVQNRSQEMLQIYTLNSQVRTLERKKAATLVEIGRLVYEKYQRSADVSEEALQSKTREVADYEHEILVLQAELDAVKEQNAPDTSTSRKSEYKAGYSHTSGFHCPSCDAQANIDKSFCPSCGSSLKDAADAFHAGRADDKEEKDITGF